MSEIALSIALPADPLAALRLLVAAEHELDLLRHSQIAAARAAGASWQQIGDALGVSRQSAWEAFTARARAALASEVAADGTLDDDEAGALAVDEVRAVRRRRTSN